MASNRSSTNKSEKRKRVVLTINQKIDICKRLDEGENRNILMREYNVGSSTIYDIKAQKEKLLQFYASSETSKLVDTRCTLHKPKLDQLDSALYEWFALKRSEGAPISGPMLVEKAKEYYEKMGLTEPCIFSNGWLTRFKRRHGIRQLSCFKHQHRIRRLSVEKKSTDTEAANNYCDFFNKLVAMHDMSPNQEITESDVNPEMDNEAAEDSEDVDVKVEKMKWKSAAAAFTTLLKFEEQKSCYSAQEAIQLHILHNTFMHKWQKLKKQTDTRSLFELPSKDCGRTDDPKEVEKDTIEVQDAVPSTSTDKN